MKVLLTYNHYRQPGGEDTVFEAEKALLERHGHEVVTFLEDNARLEWGNPLKVAMNAIWSREAQRNIRKLIEQARPEVHFHNTFLRISPAAYYVFKDLELPVVQTLHNYRLICPGALLMRDGKACEDCLRKIVPWPGVVHGCWRNSRSGTMVVAAMLTFHNVRRTWENQVDVCFKNFSRTPRFLRKDFFFCPSHLSP